MDSVAMFRVIGRKQLAIQEGIHLLLSLRSDLARTRSMANAWGTVAVIANATLIPLNVVVNALELKTATSLYQLLVQQLYAKLATGHSRSNGHVTATLEALKKAIIAELKRRSLTNYIPGVNILVGVAQDSWAAWESITLWDAGSREFLAIAHDIETKILIANQELVQLGSKYAALLEVAQIRVRTA